MKRRPRFRRIDDFPDIRITKRDLFIFRWVGEFGVLDTPLILDLASGSRQGLTRRLQLLYHHGYLNRHRNPNPIGNHPLIYSLTIKGSKLLQNCQNGAAAPRRFPSNLFLLHDLEVARVVLEIRRKVLASKRRFIPCFELFPEMRRPTWELRFLGRRANLIPDAVFGIDHGKRIQIWMLELDRGTMPIDRSNRRSSSIGRKIDVYSVFRRTMQNELRHLKLLVHTSTSSRALEIRKRFSSMDWIRIADSYSCSTYFES